MDLMSEDMLQDGFTKIVLKNAKKKLEFDKKKCMARCVYRLELSFFKKAQVSIGMKIAPSFPCYNCRLQIFFSRPGGH